MVAYHTDIPYLSEQGCDNPWLFLEAEWDPREENFGNTDLVVRWTG